MLANKMLVGDIVDLGNDVEPAEVLDVELDGKMVALRLRQEGKLRGVWVAMPATAQIRRLRR